MARDLTDYNKSYYQSNKRNRTEEILIRQHKIRDAIYEMKVNAGCSICGYNKSPRALQFHHVDPSTKKYEVALMVRRGMSLTSIQAEIDKCVIICANCHAELHDDTLV